MVKKLLSQKFKNEIMFLVGVDLNGPESTKKAFIWAKIAIFGLKKLHFSKFGNRKVADNLVTPSMAALILRLCTGGKIS